MYQTAAEPHLYRALPGIVEVMADREPNYSKELHTCPE